MRNNTKVLLPIKGVKQKSVLCGPACLEMILFYYGYRITQEQIGKDMKAKRQGGTYPFQLVRYLDRFGIQSKKVARIDIDKYLRYPRPAVLGLKAHFVLLVGRINGALIIIDPYTGRKNIVKRNYLKDVKDYIVITGVKYE